MKHILYIFLLLSTISVSAEEISLNLGNIKHDYEATLAFNIKIGKDKINQSISIGYSFNKENELNGINTISFSYSSIKNEKKKKDSITVIDTKKPQYPFATYLKGILQKGTAIKTKKGCVIDSTFNYAAFTNQIFENAVKQPDSIHKRSIEYRISSTYGELMIRSLIEGATHIAPDSSIKVGASWEKRCNYIGNTNAPFKFRYTLKKQTENTYIIEGTSTFDGNEGGYFAIDGIKYLLEGIKGTCTSQIKMDKRSGLVKEATYTLSFKGTASALTMFGIAGESRTEDIEASIKQTIAQ